MFNFGKIFRDIVAKGLTVLGGSTVVTGIATAEEWAAISGGVIAIIGVVMQGFNKAKELRDIAVVATAVDEKKTTAEVTNAVASGSKILQPVGTKKNLDSR